jgi:hypothetical protein
MKNIEDKKRKLLQADKKMHERRQKTDFPNGNTTIDPAVMYTCQSKGKCYNRNAKPFR